MKRIVNLGETRQFTVTDESLNAIEFNAHIIADAVNTSLTSKTVDFGEVDVNIVLTQGGQKLRLYAGDLRALMMTNAIKQGIFGSMFDSADNYSDGVVTTVADTSVKEVRVVPCRIQFGQGFVLKGNDKIDIDVTVGPSAFHADSDASSYITVRTEQVVTNQFVSCFWEKHVIENDKENFEKNIGNNVAEMYIINTDKTSAYEGDAIFSRLELSSDRRSFNRTWEDMIACRHTEAPRQINADTSSLLQNFCLSKDGELDNVRLSMVIDTTAANAGKNYLIVKRFYTNRALTAKATSRKVKHTRQGQSKLGINA